MRIASVLTASVLSVTLIGCGNSASPIAPSTSSTAAGMTGSSVDLQGGGRSSLPTIAGIATSDSGFSTLVAALVKADLVTTFTGDRHFTVFAPTNAAFDALAKALGFADGPALVAGVDVGTLTAILQFHVTLGDRNAQSVISSGKVRMLDGNTATISVTGAGVFIEGAKIIATDIRASNGIVHVIDAVIVPPSAK